MVQVGMSIKLFCGAGKVIIDISLVHGVFSRIIIFFEQINSKPIYTIKVFGWWREWSVIYLMAMLLHAMVVLMLMEDSQRRLISLGTSLAHALLRYGRVVNAYIQKKIKLSEILN